MVDSAFGACGGGWETGGEVDEERGEGEEESKEFEHGVCWADL